MERISGQNEPHSEEVLARQDEPAPRATSPAMGRRVQLTRKARRSLCVRRRWTRARHEIAVQDFAHQISRNIAEVARRRAGPAIAWLV